MPDIERHKAALSRTGLSKPVKLLLDEGLLQPDATFFDYGCGKGGDVRRLRKRGFEAAGWDPHFAPDEPRSPAAVVNLGFVLNVIESPTERREVLTDAWALTQHALLIAVRPTADLRDSPGRLHGDGYVTRIGTFQKFYDQTELKNWVGSVTGARPVPLAPGIVLLFRDDRARQAFVADRFRRSIAVSSGRRAHDLHEAYPELFEGLYEQFVRLGRLPEGDEWPEVLDVVHVAGSRRRASAVLREVHGAEHLRDVHTKRAEDLLVFLALERFEGRARFGQLDESLQRDVKAFFGTYKEACRQADRFLFSAGDQILIDAACRDSIVGKLMPDALFLHVSGLPYLDGVLRVVEGCARNLVGGIEGANVLKIHRRKPKISYLSYPDFDRVGHPALAFSVSVNLRDLTAKWHDFQDRENPPILHRKELFVPEEYPGRKKFARLSRQEHNAGLLGSADIGTEVGWNRALKSAGLTMRGHRLRRLPSSP